MPEPTLLTHGTTYSRWTLQQLRDYAMLVAGGVWGDLNSTEQGLLDLLINAAHSKRVGMIRNARRWAEDSVTLTWVGTDTRIAIPANVGEIVGRHLWIVDANDQPLEQVEIIREEEARFWEESAWDDPEEY